MKKGPYSAARATAVRTALRQEMIDAREALPAEEHQQLSEAIDGHLEILLAACQPRIIGFCWPFRAEFDCRPLVIRWRLRGTRCCLPVVTSPQEPLQFRAWHPDSEMLTDRYGIHYPATGESLIPDVLLMPVNAFDDQGYRLGYGAGYFDRTLAALAPPPLAIGIGFELARVASIEPAPHDIPLDAVVTETGTMVISSRLTQKLRP